MSQQPLIAEETAALQELPESPHDSVLDRLIQNSEILWQQIVQVTKGERDAGYHRGAAGLAGSLAFALGVEQAQYVVYSGGDLASVINGLIERLGSPQMLEMFPFLQGMDEKVVMMLNAVSEVNEAEAFIFYHDHSRIRHAVAAVEQQLQAVNNPLVNQYFELVTTILTHISLVTIAGSDALAYAPEGVQAEWQARFHDAVCRHNREEIQKNRQADTIPDPVEDPIEAVLDYAARFGNSSALGIGVIGGIAHRRASLAEGDLDFFSLEDGTDFKFLMDMYRVVQDLQVDPDERINVGIWCYAAMHQVTVAEARQVLRSSSDERRSVNRLLIESWEDQFILRLDEIIAAHRDVDPHVSRFLVASKDIFSLIKIFKLRGEV